MVEQLLNMTWRNPFFIFVLIVFFWYLPGLLLRIYRKNQKEILHKRNQETKINSLYPKENIND